MCDATVQAVNTGARPTLPSAVETMRLTLSDRMCRVGEVKCSGVSDGGCPSQVTVLYSRRGQTWMEDERQSQPDAAVHGLPAAT